MKLTPIALAALALATSGCKKSDNDADRSSAKVTTEVLAKDVAKKPEVIKIPITTKSLEARKAFLEGRELMDQTKFLAAAPHIEKAIELDPDFALAHAHLSLIAGEGRDKNAAEATKLAPRLPKLESVYIRALVAANSNDTAKISAAIDELAEAAPQSPRALLRAGEFYAFRGNDHDKSIAYLTRAIELDPNQPTAFNALAYAHRNQNKLELAIKAAKRQVELMPGAPNPIDTLADMELAAGKFAAAEANYRKAFAADKTFTLSLASAAVTQLYRKDFDGAAATFAEAAAAETVPRWRFDRAMEGVMMKAIAGDQKAALAAASGLSESARTRGFDVSSTIALARARIHIHAGDWKRAHKETGKAVKALAKGESPDGREGFTQMARVLTSARTGDRAAASKAFAAMEAHFKNGPAHTLATAHLDWVNGDIEAALTKLESLRGGNFHGLSLAAAAAILDGAKRDDEAAAKRTELRTFYPRDLDGVMFWLAASDESRKAETE